MSEIQLGYGLDSVNFVFDESQFRILANESIAQRPLSDAEIGATFDAPIASPPLDEILTPADSVLIVVSDATRATASAQVVNLLLRRLLQNGISAADVAIIFATGIHRPVTPQERIGLLTSFIAQRIKIIDHDAYDRARLTSLGVTERGTLIEVNSALGEFSRIVLIGGIGFHYFAGFTGGRKSICPGLASAATIEATHMLALDFEHGGRRQGVGAGLLDGNAVSEECERVAAMIEPAFSINAIVDEHGHAEKVFVGGWRAAHHRACADYASGHSAKIKEKREVVIVSCGGAPYDINMIQAHKALDMAAQACVDGGTIVFLAECGDGLGRAEFMKWFESKDSRALEMRVRDQYEVNGQTAWALLTKTERFRVHNVTELGDEQARGMRMTKSHTINEALANISASTNGYI